MKFDILELIKKGIPESPQKQILVNELISAFSKGGYKSVTVSTTPVKLLSEVISRKDLLIEAALTNTGKIFLGFDNLVTNANYFTVLEAGDSWHCDSYLGEVWVITDVVGQVVTFGEW